MANPTVSIIVPIYNAELYLTQCLTSVREQTFRDFEVLMVNDGSKDHSEDICRHFSQEDSRFILISKQNSGVSDSRNVALSRAKGKYLQFLDSDDWLTENATESLVHTSESTGCDLAVGHFYRVVGERMAQRGHIRKERILTRREYAEEMMKAPANYYYGVLWNKLYRRSLLESVNLRFDPQIKWGEDFLFNLQYLEHVRLISAIPEPVYYYRKREDSLVNAEVSLRRTVAMKTATFQAYKELYQKLDLYEEQKGRVYSYFLSAAVDGAVGPLSQKLNESTK